MLDFVSNSYEVMSRSPFGLPCRDLAGELVKKARLGDTAQSQPSGEENGLMTILGAIDDFSKSLVTLSAMEAIYSSQT